MMVSGGTNKTMQVQQLWQWLAVACASVLFGMFIQQLRSPSPVTQSELTERVVELQDKIDAQTKEIVALRASVNQQSVDIAGVAAKVGSTAHPVVAPQ